MHKMRNSRARIEKLGRYHNLSVKEYKLYKIRSCGVNYKEVEYTWDRYSKCCAPIMILDVETSCLTSHEVKRINE